MSVPKPSPPGLWGTQIRSGAAELGVPLGHRQIQQLIDFLTLMAQWNRVVNLSSVRDPDQMVPRHILDSLSVCSHVDGSPVLDLGTGAGLPGVPLAIAFPQRRFVLLDSNAKKLRFVNQALLDLGLENAQVIQARIEAYRPEAKFATIVTRAVGPAAQILAQAEPLLVRTGRLLLMKGRHPEQDLAALDWAGADYRLHPLQVPFLDGERQLIEIRTRDH